MAGSRKGTSKAAQAQTLDQASAPESTNADIVLLAGKLRYTAKNEELSIISSGNRYKNGQRALDGKTYTLLQLSTENEEVNNFLSKVTDEEFEGEPTFIICEQEHPEAIKTILNGMIDTMSVTISLRLEDEKDDNSDILPSVQFKKIKSLETRVKREELEAKSRFYSSAKMNDVITASLLQSLQNA
jgi:hypothetical protein